MTIRLGSRVTYRGERWIVAGPAPFLGRKQWRLRRRDGSVRTGWTTQVAPEAALTEIEHPTFEVGQAIHVGSIRRHGTITGIEEEGGVIWYEVDFEPEIRTGDQGTRYIHESTGRVTADIIEV